MLLFRELSRTMETEKKCLVCGNPHDVFMKEFSDSCYCNLYCAMIAMRTATTAKGNTTSNKKGDVDNTPTKS